MTTINEFVQYACQRDNAMRFYGHMSVAELQERAARLVVLGKATAAKIAAGDLGAVVGSHIVRGDWVPTRAHEAALVGQRRAYAETIYVLKQKGA